MLAFLSIPPLSGPFAKVWKPWQLTIRSMLVFRGMQDRMLLASIGLQVRQLETVFEKTIAKRRRIH